MNGRFMASLLACAVALVASDTRAFSIQTGFSDGCHERFATEAFLRSLPQLPVFPDDATPDDDWEGVAAAYLDVDEDLDRGTRFFLYSLVLGARAPDTEGHSISNAQALRSAQADPEGQYLHCIRAAGDDYEAGNASALEGCREEIHASLSRALAAVMDADGERRHEVEEVHVTLDLYGAFETKVWAPAYHLGRALHTFQDSFSHSLRSPSMRSVVHVMNYEAALAGRLDEERDGLAHSMTMDRCSLPSDAAERALQVTRLAAVVDASAQLLTLTTTLTRANVEGAAPTQLLADDVLDAWLSLANPADLGDFTSCTTDNDYCASAWLPMARRRPTTPALACAVRPLPTPRDRHGAWTLGLVLLAVLVGRRRQRATRPERRATKPSARAGASR
jgi:hypothetical protein